MSAFVVEPKTINRVLTVIHGGLNGNSLRSWEFKQIQKKLQAIEWDIASQQDLKDLGLAMYNLNKNAVGQRYPDSVETNSLPGSYPNGNGLAEYRFIFEPHCDKYQALKSLQCWHYQCAEGDVPQTKLYKTFAEIGKLIAMNIVTNSPQYEAAKWD